MPSTLPDTFNEAPDNARVVFTLVSGLTPVNPEVFVGGSLRVVGVGVDGYSFVGSTFTFVQAPAAGETMVCFFASAAGAGVVVGGNAFDTVANLISDAAIELGLVQAAIADPFASTDQNIIQLLRLLKTGGRELAKRRNWTHLRKEFTFNTANGTEAYALPSDFRSLVPNSVWNRSTTFPAGGPLGSEYWQYRKAVATAGDIFTNIRLWLGQMWIQPTPSAMELVAYEYQSTSWVKPVGQVAPTLSAPAAKDDVIYFDPLLVVKRLKLDFRKAKRFDTVTEQDDYDTALYASECEDSPASTIYLGGRSNRTPRRIDRWNLPDTIT